MCILCFCIYIYVHIYTHIYIYTHIIIYIYICQSHNTCVHSKHRPSLLQFRLKGVSDRRPLQCPERDKRTCGAPWFSSRRRVLAKSRGLQQLPANHIGSGAGSAETGVREKTQAQESQRAQHLCLCLARMLLDRLQN